MSRTFCLSTDELFCRKETCNRYLVYISQERFTNDDSGSGLHLWHEGI